MKIRTDEYGFQPLDLVITLESKDEVEAFYAIFNYTPLLSATNLDGDAIREAITRARGEPQYYSVHRKLCNMD